MPISAFDRWWAFLQRPDIEGGARISDDPNDPGGLTRWGISQRAYPDEDIRNMTEARAKMLARRDYWDLVYGDQLPATVAIVLADSSFNQGVEAAIRILQRALDVTADGVIGPITFAAASRFGDPEQMNELFSRRLMRYAEGKAGYRHGWFLRVLRLKDALA